MEIEAKYAILGPLNPNILITVNLGPYELRPEGESHHHDVLLDTPARAITSGGHTLRIRYSDDQAVLTVKGPNHGTGGVHEREEIEASLPEHTGYDYHGWPEAIASRIGALAGDAHLAPLVKVYIHRHRWAVIRGTHTVGELVIDQGVINAGGRTARVHELELELKGAGNRTDLRALDKRLLEQLPLQPQPRGKLQRGLALLRRNHPLDGHTPLRAVSLHMLRRYQRRWRSSEPVARAGSDPEGIHDMRVAIRRLRVSLRLLEESGLFERERLRGLRRRLRGAAQALGAVRDADILLKRVEAYRDANPGAEDDLHVLITAVRRQRKAARKRLLRSLDGRKLVRAKRQLDDLTALAGPNDDAQPAFFVRHFAGSAIWRRYERILRYESVVAGAPPTSLHRLRIACKHLRYALEFFESELGKATKPLVRALVQVQDHLGDLQDTVVALDAVNALCREHPANRELARFAAAMVAERDRLRAGFEPLWEDLSDAGISQELAELVAAL